MPPAAHHAPTNSTKKVWRKTAEDDELEMRRMRGEVSCAECRRLKLRCDKRVPCGSCARRGCSSICPNGSLSSGQGTRFILADTKALHKKIAEMSQRIRQLEDGLAIVYAGISHERHPLLSDELVKIKFGSEAIDPSATPDVEESMSYTLDALGTLALDDKGQVKYFGRSAGSETLLLVGEQSANDEIDEPTLGLPEISQLANLFPFTTRRTDVREVVLLLISQLPDESRVLDLCNTYFAHASFSFRPLVQEELFDEILTPLYNIIRDGGSSEDFTDYCPHALAVLFFTIAISALFDLSLPPSNSEAERYYDLGRAALSLKSVFDSPQIQTVQAVALMGTYHGVSATGKNHTRDSVWSIIALASKLAQSIGLHRDSSNWNLDPHIVQRRRILFWEIYFQDIIHSLAMGRPPSIQTSYVDCELPRDDEETVTESGEVRTGFFRWKYGFVKEIFSSVAEATLMAKPPSYSTILDLDRKVRQIAFPSTYNPYPSPGDVEYHDPAATMKSFYLSYHRMITMLYLHRSYFAQALLDYPSNPLSSPFGPSCLAATRCASIIIRAYVHQFHRCPEIAARLCTFLTHTFSAAVVVGSLVARSPSSEMAPGALRELKLAVDTFGKVAAHSHRARVALHVLLKLQDKATQAFAQHRAGTFTVANPSLGVSSEDAPDELAIFGGQLRILPRKCPVQKYSPTSSPLSTLGSFYADVDGHFISSFPDCGVDLQPPVPYQFNSNASIPQASQHDQSQQNWQGQKAAPLPFFPQQGPAVPRSMYSDYGASSVQTTGVPSQNMSNYAAPADDTQTIDMTLAAGMDKQWVSFLQDAGLFDGGHRAPASTVPMAGFPLTAAYAA